MFEIAAGGILAAVAVPLDRPPARGRAARPGRPHGIRAAVVGPARARAAGRPALAVRGADLVVAASPSDPSGRRRSPPRCCGSSPCRCRSTAWASSSPGCSRPTAASSRPRWHRWRRRSSCSCPTSGTARSSTARSSPSLVSDEAIRVLGWGTTLGVVVLSVPLVVPAMRTGWRWRPALRMPSDDARRIGALAGAGVIALLAQQAAVARHAVAVQADRRQGHLHGLHLRPGRLPAALRRARRPGRHERLPGPGGTHRGAGRTSPGPCARSLRAVLVLTALSVGVLIAAAPADRRLLLAARRPSRRRRHEHRGARRAARDAHRLRPGPGRLRPERPADPGHLRARAPHRCRHRRRHRVVRRGPASPRRARRRAEPGGDPALAGHRVDPGHDPVRGAARAARAPHLGRRGHPGRRPHLRGPRRRGRAGRRGR